MKLDIEISDELGDELFGGVLRDTVECATNCFDDLSNKLKLQEYEQEDFVMLRDYLAAAKVVAEYHGVKL